MVKLAYCGRYSDSFFFNFNPFFSLLFDKPFSVFTSPSVHVCISCGLAAHHMAGGDTKILSLSNILDLCQILLFLLHSFPSLTSVTELAMLSCSAAHPPPPLPPLLLLSSHHFLISHSPLYRSNKLLQ